MVKEKIMKHFLVLLACMAMLACGDKSDGPASVAEQYWAAVLKGDQTRLEQLSVSEPAAQVSVFTSKTTIEGDKIRELSFGETIEEGDYARVATTIVPEADAEAGALSAVEISFDTYLIKADGQWKVEKTRTEKNIMGAAIAAAMGAMGEALGEGMKEAVEGIGEAVSEGMQAVMEGLSEGLGEGFSQGQQNTPKDLATPGSGIGGSAGAQQQEHVSPTVLPARVSGLVRGTDVELSSAVWSNTLAIYSGEGWGFNPSLLIFLFLGEGEVPAARTITVNSAAGGFNNPHVHYRWSDPESGDIKTEVLTMNYDMELKFGEPVDRRVSGEIQFSVPGEDTRVSGTFEIELAR